MSHRRRRNLSSINVRKRFCKIQKKVQIWPRFQILFSDLSAQVPYDASQTLAQCSHTMHLEESTYEKRYFHGKVTSQNTLIGLSITQKNEYSINRVHSSKNSLPHMIQNFTSVTSTT